MTSAAAVPDLRTALDLLAGVPGQLASTPTPADPYLELAGVPAGRERSALLLGTTPDRLAFELLAALERPVPPVVVPAVEAPCQEVVLRPPFDIRRLLPAPSSTWPCCAPRTPRAARRT